MTNLISGKEALIALANGEDVESRHRAIDKVWSNAKCLLLVKSFLDPATLFDFRLKPRTITINGIEVPAPFEPSIGDAIFVLCPYYGCGYRHDYYQEDRKPCIRFGAWRTEDEIKQVVEALRHVFGKEMKDG